MKRSFYIGQKAFLNAKPLMAWAKDFDILAPDRLARSSQIFPDKGATGSENPGSG